MTLIRGLAGILLAVAFAGGRAEARDPAGDPENLERFLTRRHAEIAGECDFSGKKANVVHEAAFTQFKAAVERQVRRDGSDVVKTEWGSLAGLAPHELARTPVFPAILRSYASIRYQKDLRTALRELIRCPTIGDTTIAITANPPFVRATAIVDSLARAHEFEFSVLVDGLALELAFGSGPDTLGIWGHLDVVPADTSGWSVDPWAGAFRDSVLEARGSEDDKGPFLAALFALRALRDTGVPMTRRVVLFGGFAEETTFSDIEGYLKVRPAPSTNVVVDGSFPVVIAEKGLTTITVSSSFKRTPLRLCRTGYIIRGLTGGLATNQVPAHAELRLFAADKKPNGAFFQIERKVKEFNEANSRARLTVTRDGSEVVVTATGKAAHGSTPKEGHNAIVDIVEFLYELNSTCGNPPHWVAMFVNEFIHEDTGGHSLGIAMNDSIMGATTVNVGRIGMEADSAWVKLDIRFPRGLTSDAILETITERIQDFNDEFSAGLLVTRRSDGLKPIYVSAESDLVRSLLKSYEDVYGREGKAVSEAGTTYAKLLPNAVSFGPSLPGEKIRAHSSGEFVTAKELDDLVRVYATAFFRLTAVP